MKRKYLLIIPALALILSGCNIGKKKSSNSQGDSSSSSQPAVVVNYGSESSPVSVATVLEEMNKLINAGLAAAAYSEQPFFVTGKLSGEITGVVDKYVYVLEDATNSEKTIDVSSAVLESGKTPANYMEGDTFVVRSYGRNGNGSNKTKPYLTFNKNEGVENPAPTIISCTPIARPDPTGISFAEGNAYNIGPNATRQLTAVLAPKGAEGTIDWAASPVDTKLTVSSSGLVTTTEAVVDDVYTVTATVRGTTLSANATFTISNLHEETVTFTAGTDLGSRTETGEKDEITKDGITMEGNPAAFAAVSQGKYTYRFYASSTVTFTSTVGDITEIQITSPASDDAQYGPAKLTGDGYSYSGTVGTWTGSSSLVTLEATAQARATEVVVTYLTNGEPPAPIVPTSVTVAPATVNVKPGRTQTFTATLGPSGATGTVEWSVEPISPAAAGMVEVVPSTGVVTVKEGASPDDQYKIWATYTENAEVKGFATLTVIEDTGSSTYTLTPNQASTGLSDTSYVTTLTSFTYEGVSWKMNQWNPNTLQIKTNQGSAASEFRFYNTSAFSGKITQVVITFEALTVSEGKENGFMFVGGSSEISTTTGGTAAVWNSTAKTLTWTPSNSDNFSYFAFYQDGKVATGTNKLAASNAIVVTYE